MTTTVVRPGPPAPPAPAAARLPWVTSTASGLAVLLAGVPVGAVVQGGGWFGCALGVAAAVVAVGLALHRFGSVVVAAGQGAAVLMLLTVLFSDDGLLGLLPGPTSFDTFGALVAGAGSQINTGFAPVPATPEILFLVTAAFGLLTIAVQLAAVGAAAPAAAGVPLLAVFAVPAALADDLLPWGSLVAAALGFGVLLVARDDPRPGGWARAVRRLPGAAALIAAALVLALGAGAVTGFVGTSGRFLTGSGESRSGGSIGLSPFTALRGQLEQTDSSELLRVRGLPRPTYLRALTLRDYVSGVGWQATQPAPGATLPGSLDAPAPDVPGDTEQVYVENRAFRDYWLPLYGLPLDISGVPEGQWVYDETSGTGYTTRPREEDGWSERAFLPAPTAEQLRAASGTAGAGPEYLTLDGVPQEVLDLAGRVVAGRDTAFDRALALQDWFTGPGSAFTYSLRTAPGTGGDALLEFLTVGRTGYCEQFASAMAVMLRAVGVPARVAIGFTAGIDAGGYRSVSTADAHAWVEAWFPGVGWTTFDPTPLTDGRAITPPYVVEAQRGEGGDSAPQTSDLAPDKPVEQSAAPEAAQPDAPTPGAAAPLPASGGLPLWPVVMLLAVVAVVLAPTAVRLALRRRRLSIAGAGGPGAAVAAWDELMAESTDRGVSGASSETVRGAARRLVREHRLDEGAQQSLREVVGAVESSWYGQVHPGPGELDGALDSVRRAITASGGLTPRTRILPRSVLGLVRSDGRSPTRWLAGRT